MSARTLLQEAQDAGTSSHRLREIYDASKWSNAVAAEAVAAHPNTPPDLLERLAVKYPQIVLDNPGLPHILLTDPDWPRRFQHGAEFSLLRFDTVPIALLRAFAEQPNIIGQMARLHVGLAGEAGPEWEADAREALWDALGLLRMEGTTPAFMVTFPIPLLTLDLVPDWLLEPLAAHPDARVRQAVTRHPRTPPDVLTPLRRAGSTSDLGGLAPPDLSLPVPVLERLARGGSWAKRLAARHPNTPPDVLETLAAAQKTKSKNDKDRALCRFLVQNLGTPSTLRETLAAEFDTEFRRASARDPQTPPPALAALALSEVRDVRWMAARNPNTPREALKVLAGDPDARIRQGVGRNTVTPQNLLAVLAADPVCWVRLAAARHPQTPPDILAVLAKDNDKEVRQSVARRFQPRSSVPRIAKPAKPAPAEVPKRMPPAADPAERAKALQDAGDHEGSLAKMAVLACPDTPLRLLIQGASAPLWIVRFAVARNPAAFLASLEQPGTEDVLRSLSHDGNRFVRAAAREALQKLEGNEQQGGT